MAIRAESIGFSSLRFWLGGFWRATDELLRYEDKELTLIMTGDVHYPNTYDCYFHVIQMLEK
jgi:hypothetical protein